MCTITANKGRTVQRSSATPCRVSRKSFTHFRVTINTTKCLATSNFTPFTRTRFCWSTHKTDEMKNFYCQDGWMHVFTLSLPQLSFFRVFQCIWLSALWWLVTNERHWALYCSRTHNTSKVRARREKWENLLAICPRYRLQLQFCTVHARKQEKVQSVSCSLHFCSYKFCCSWKMFEIQQTE